MAGASRREILIAAILLGTLTLALLWLVDGAILLIRPLWVDEVHTVLVARRPSPAAIVSDLANGADFGPPLIHFGAWLVGLLPGGLSPLALRLLSLACICAALLVLYAVLRRTQGRDASAAATLAVGSSALIVAHAYEARYYGPWVLCATLFAWSLRAGPLRSRRDDALVAATATLLCMVHWYGVIGLGLMAGGALISRRDDWRQGLRMVAPAAAGLVVTVLLLPLAVGQRRALSSSTWVPDFRWNQLAAFADAFWFPQVVQVAAAAGAIGWLIARQRRQHPPVPALRDASREPGLMAVAALALIPLALAALSLVGQPSMLARYAILAVLAWGPLVAVALSLAGRWPARAFAAYALVLWFATYTRQVRARAAFAAGVRQTVTAIDAARQLGLPAVIMSMHSLYAAVPPIPGAAHQPAFLELSDEALDILVPDSGRFAQLNKGIRIERDVVRVHATRFRFPKLVPLTLLDTVARFALVGGSGNLPRGYSSQEALVATLFPRHRLVRVEGELALLERAPPK